YLEPVLGGAPVAGGEDDGVEGVALAVGELDVAAADALDGGREDADLAGPDLGEGADVHDRVHRGGGLHGEGPDGRPPEAVAGGVAEHGGAHEQHHLVDHPHRQVPVQRHRQVPYLLAHQVQLRSIN
ncbi:Os01g0273850, partial [Oryza sativa Japonica Group]